MDILVVTGSGASEFVAGQQQPGDLVLDVVLLRVALGGSAAADVLAREVRDEALKRLNLVRDVERVWVAVPEDEDALTVQRRLRRRAALLVVDTPSSSADADYK